MNKPWYRHGMVWLVLAPLIGTVVASGITLYLAGAEPALVVDDFGPIAMAVERDQQRDRHAAELGLTASLQLGERQSNGDQAISVQLTGATPASLVLELVHPTRAELDQRVMLERGAVGYGGSVPRADTRLYLLLTDPAGSWRLSGVLERQANLLELTAGR